MIYKGQVLAGKDPNEAGFIKIDHPLVQGEWIGPIMNTPGTIQVPAETSEVCFMKVEGQGGAWEYAWVGELWSSNAMRRLRVDEIDSTLGSTQTGVIAAPNTGYGTDYNTYGIHTIHRVHSPNSHHSIELMEQINPTLDLEGPVQEFLGIKLRTQDGKGIFLDDGQGKGKDGIKLYLQEGEEDKNVIQMSKGGDENGVAPESLTIVMNNNVEITSSKGNIAIAVATGEGGITIQNLGTGPVEIDSGGEVSVSAIGDISVVSTQGDVNVEAGDGEDHDIDCEHTLKVAAGGSSAGNTVDGDITCPVTKHTKVNINGKTAITLR